MGVNLMIGTWAKLPPMTTPRTTYTIARAPDGRFYAIRRERFTWGGRSTLVRGSIAWDRQLTEAVLAACWLGALSANKTKTWNTFTRLLG